MWAYSSQKCRMPPSTLSKKPLAPPPPITITMLTNKQANKIQNARSQRILSTMGVTQWPQVSYINSIHDHYWFPLRSVCAVLEPILRPLIFHSFLPTTYGGRRKVMFQQVTSIYDSVHRACSA